jgi:hypothetical protein
LLQGGLDCSVSVPHVLMNELINGMPADEVAAVCKRELSRLPQVQGYGWQVVVVVFRTGKEQSCGLQVMIVARREQQCGVRYECVDKQGLIVLDSLA